MSGDREVQRTMLELLNQLDGFSSNDNVKIIAATNRPDILDPALMRSGARSSLEVSPPFSYFNHVEMPEGSFFPTSSRVA